MSTEGRWLFLDKVDAIIDRLKELRLRAMQHASPASVAAFAAEMPLPDQDCVSATQPPDESQLGWQPGGAAQELPYEPCFADGDDADGDMYAIRDTWFAALDAEPNGFYREEGVRGGGSQHEPEEQNHKHSHVFLGAWRDTFPGRLETRLDSLDGGTSPGPGSLVPAPDLDAQADGEPPLHVGESTESPISSATLLRLQQEMDDVCRCRRSRWHRRRSGGDLASLMKSGGVGSPLVESIAANEP